MWEKYENKINMLIIAHRGAGKPENSLEAAERAIKVGCDGVEIDIRRCADKIVCLHDATLERTTNLRGSLVLYPYSRLKNLVPSFDQLVKFVGKKTALHLHVKEDSTIKEIIKSLKRHRVKAEILTRSSDVAILARKHELPVRFSSHYEMTDFCKKFGIYAIDLTQRKNDEEVVKNLHRMGFKVTIFLRKNFKLFQYYKSIGIDAVTTDDTERCLRDLSRFGKESEKTLFDTEKY